LDEIDDLHGGLSLLEENELLRAESSQDFEPTSSVETDDETSVVL